MGATDSQDGKVKGDDFFREFTLRICGSLNIGEALWNCLLYVRGVLPADELMLAIYDPVLRGLEVVARAKEKEFSTGRDKVQIPPDLRKELEDVEHYRRVRTCVDVHQDPILHSVNAAGAAARFDLKPTRFACLGCAAAPDRRLTVFICFAATALLPPRWLEPVMHLV